ncbi:MAG: hypothetical protein ACOYIE_04375 [Agathobaculum sp.]|jgi:ethanolamine utilization protein|uniref:hypothetical protein n=1 Tax=Agathobaculum sp. TaxID=2048138 RepID=UPI003D89C372
MERAELIEEIVRRVAARLSAMDETEPQAQKQGLLLLTQTHGTECPCALESEAVRTKWRVDCALQHEYQVNLDDYEAVVISGLDCGALDRIASGTWSCDYTRLATQAILMGKRIYILAEEVELYRYRESAPTVYYKMMQQKLDFLQAAGAVLCTRTDLEQLLTEGTAAPKKQTPAAETCPAAEKKLSKRVLTERDLFDAEKQGAHCIRVSRGCIITALAKDTAAAHGISIVME